jgi:outer membrane protein
VKNVIKASLLALAFALPVAASAQNIAVVSLENAILQTELAQEIIKKEEGNAVFKDKTSQLEKLSTELKSMADTYKRDEAVLSAEQKQAQQQLMESKQSEGLAIQQQLVNAQQQLRTALVRNNQQIVFQAAQQVAKDEGVDILLNASAVLYMKDVNDITAKVTDSLNQKKDK